MMRPYYFNSYKGFEVSIFQNDLQSNHELQLNEDSSIYIPNELSNLQTSQDRCVPYDENVMEVFQKCEGEEKQLMLEVEKYDLDQNNGTIEDKHDNMEENKNESKEEVKRKQRKKIDTGMNKRKDQVMRDLLRRIKRIYRKSFYENTDYLKSNKDAESLHRCLVQYAELRISEIDSEKIAFTLGCMIFQAKITDLIFNNNFTFINDSEKSNYISMIDTIQGPFRRYNKQNLKSFINCCEIATVLTHFPEVLIPFKFTEDEAVGFGIIEDECMQALNY